MARQVTCENGHTIGEYGWKLVPARNEGGELVGTVAADEEAKQHELVGDPLDACLECVKVRHPRAPEPAKKARK
jgi:hypothetical protein